MKNKLQLSKYFFFISAFTTIAILAFIVQAGYNKLMKPDPQVTKDSAIDPLPLDAKLSLEVIDLIQKTQEYTNSDLVVIPTIIPDETATASASPNQ